MAAVALDIDPLKTFGDGVRASAGGREWPLPLASTDVSVAEDGGLAVVRTTRTFRNAETGPIEVVMTFPVPGDAILTGLRASIDGRDLVAVAQASQQARQTYEDAVDAGKTAILHEEKLRGVHMLSLGNLPPGKEASVVVTYVAPLSFVGAVPTLRVPVTVGEVFGRSPLLPCDDLVAGDVRLEASVTATSGTAIPQISGSGGASGRFVLDRSIEVAFPGWTSRGIQGRSADGRAVSVEVVPLGGGELPLDLTLLYDRSGSTGNYIEGDDRGNTVWDAMMGGLRTALAETLRDGDRLAVVEFDSSHRHLGQAAGPGAVDLLGRIGRPQNGTNIGVPLIDVAKSHAGDVLLVTDGKSHSLDVQTIAALGRRVSVVLVGSDALDAAVGHVAALTGGMTFVVAGADVAGAARAALSSLRIASGPPKTRGGDTLPAEAAVLRGGARIRIVWSADGAEAQADDIGRLAAGLVLPALATEAATRIAVEHGLCTHLTSLVVVDEAGEAQQGIPATRKVPMMRSAFDVAVASAAPLGGAATRSLSASRSPTGYGSLRGAGSKGMFSAGRNRFSVDALRSPSLESFGPQGTSDNSRGGSAGSPPRPLPFPDSAPPAPAAPALPPEIGSPELARLLDLKGAAARVDWDDVAARVEAEGVSAFPNEVRLLLVRLAGLPSVAALAGTMGCTPEILAIALLAKAGGDGSRSAARVARRTLKGGPDEADALRSVGLAA